jgi:hypothetical protein
VHFTGCGVAASAALFVHLSSPRQRAAENGFAADDGSVSGDGRSSRCCTVGELLRDCDWVSAIAVTRVCDEKGPASILPPRRSGRSALTISNVRTEQKQIEKLRYIHRNPVKRGLADCREQWSGAAFVLLPIDWPGAGEISGAANGDQGSSGREVLVTGAAHSFAERE